MDMLYQDVSITTEDGCILKGWFVHHKYPKTKKTVVYLHENAGNIGFRLGFISMMHNYLDVNVIIVGYRGFGHST